MQDNTSETNQLGELIRTMASVVLVLFAVVVGGVVWTLSVKLGINPFNDDVEDTLLDELLERARAQLNDGGTV